MLTAGTRVAPGPGPPPRFCPADGVLRRCVRHAPFWALALIAIDVFTIIETGTDSYRLASTRARAEETAKAG